MIEPSLTYKEDKYFGLVSIGVDYSMDNHYSAGIRPAMWVNL